jgi:hypothetical protein
LPILLTSLTLTIWSLMATIVAILPS